MKDRVRLALACVLSSAFGAWLAVQITTVSAQTIPPNRLSGGTFDGDVDHNGKVAVNIGNAGTDFLSTGGLDLAARLRLNAGPTINEGANTPEGALTAPIGSLFLRNNGGAGTTLYVKESGAGNTGWLPYIPNPMTTQGDIITGGAAGAVQRLALGASPLALVSNGTDVVYAPRYNCRLTKSAGQTISNATNTTITFDTEAWDYGSLHSVSAGSDATITVPSDGAGLWLIVGYITWAANATGIRRGTILVNGTGVTFPTDQTVSQGGIGSASIYSLLWQASANDIFSLQGRQDSGGNLATGSGTDSISFSATILVGQ